MKFMESPFVQRALEEIEYLQDHIKEVSIIFVENVSDDESEGVDQLKLEFLHSLYALAEKEHILMTRITLSQDEEGLKYKKQILKEMVRINPNEQYTDVDCYFRDLKNTIKGKIKELTGEDMDDYEGIDIVFNWTDGSF
jgi:hypothetical protein